MSSTQRLADPLPLSLAPRDAGPEGGGALTCMDAFHVLVVDDHPLFRAALSSAIALSFPRARLDEAEGIDAACSVLEANRGIDLMLLDLSMRGVTGLQGLITIRARFPRVPILIVSSHEDPRVARAALEHGASGYVSKAMDKSTLVRAIDDVLNGRLFLPSVLAEPARSEPSRKAPLAERIARLTPQQLRVLTMIRQGKLNKQIAHELNVGNSTVKAHVSEILRKLEVISRTQIVIDTNSIEFDADPV